MAYSGLFVRDNLGQTPGGGQDGWSASPDIIPYGVTPAPNTGMFVSPSGYAQDFGAAVYLNQANFVYLRALNTAAGAIGGTAWLYYTPNDLMLWPNNWQSANILVNGVATNCQPIAAGVNQVCVSEAFVWTPPVLFPGSAGKHYCCISWMENPPLQSPPWTPLSDIPNFSTCEELAAFVCTHPNMGFRNTVDVSQAGPSWQQTTNVTGPRAGGHLRIGIVCRNMPTDGYIAFAVPGSGSVPTLNFPKTLIWDPDAAPMIAATWPPNFVTSITMSYWQGATVPPPGASITAVVVMPESQLDSKVMNAARTTAPWRLRTTRLYDHAGVYMGEEARSVVFGSLSCEF